MVSFFPDVAYINTGKEIRYALYHVYRIKTWPKRKPRCVNMTRREVASIVEKKHSDEVCSYSAHSIVDTSVPSDHFDIEMNLYHRSFAVRSKISIKLALDGHYEKSKYFWLIIYLIRKRCTGLVNWQSMETIAWFWNIKQGKWHSIQQTQRISEGGNAM